MRFNILIDQYNEVLSKRQPWYTVKALRFVLENAGYDVSINGDLLKDQIEIKVFGLMDLFRTKDRIFLMTFPFYSFEDIAKNNRRELWAMRKGLWRIFICSLIPQHVVNFLLRKAKLLIVTSDRYSNSLSHLDNSVKWYPYISDLRIEDKVLYDGLEKQSIKTFGYFGSPIYSRGFDITLDLMCKIEDNANGVRFHILSRIEREELLESESKYLRRSPKNIYINSGFLSRDELRDELQRIDVFILPFRFVLSEFPIVVLEALELGKKVIIPRGIGFDDLLQGNDNVKFIDISGEISISDILTFSKETLGENIPFQHRINSSVDDLLSGLCRK